MLIELVNYLRLTSAFTNNHTLIQHTIPIIELDQFDMQTIIAHNKKLLDGD